MGWVSRFYFAVDASNPLMSRLAGLPLCSPGVGCSGRH